MLRVCPTDGAHSTVLNVDVRSRQVVLRNPTAGGAITSHVTAQRHISPPKMFAFDAVFTPNDCLVRVFLSCTVSLLSIICALNHFDLFFAHNYSCSSVVLRAVGVAD